MYQFCYASKSTSLKTDLLEDLANILKEARDFNYQHQVTGVLYFADGHFFQCLEGECPTLKSLLVERLNKDPRHQDIKLFETKEIEYPSFPDWSMKYISKRSQIQQFCREMGFDDFNPFAFQQSKRPLNPMSIFNSVQVSSGVAVILLFGSLYGSAIFSAHHLNRHMDPTHSALLTGLKS